MTVVIAEKRKGGKSRKANLIYEANIVTDNNTNTYIGLSSNEIKK